jgi:hypothetical protein
LNFCSQTSKLPVLRQALAAAVASAQLSIIAAKASTAPVLRIVGSLIGNSPARPEAFPRLSRTGEGSGFI